MKKTDPTEIFRKARGVEQLLLSAASMLHGRRGQGRLKKFAAED